MRTGVQFTGILAPYQSNRWYTFGWSTRSPVVWDIVPTSRFSGASQLDWNISVELHPGDRCTYWITVTNLADQVVTFEARYTSLNMDESPSQTAPRAPKAVINAGGPDTPVDEMMDRLSAGAAPKHDTSE